MNKKNIKYLTYPWDILLFNSEEILTDLKRLDFGQPKKLEQVNFINRPEIFIGKRTLIMPGVTLNAETGPIIIDENVTIK